MKSVMRSVGNEGSDPDTEFIITELNWSLSLDLP